MIKFENRFVHFRWDDSLAGKKCLYGDNICDLEDDLNSAFDESDIVSKNDGFNAAGNFPFKVNGDIWRFVYYDPNYEVKRAFEDGKQIQFRSHVDGTWCDCGDFCSTKKSWSDDYEYRIKPEEPKKRATYRELSEWLAKGKGQFRSHVDATMVYTFMDYSFDADDKEVPEDYLIRPWDSNEWVVPTKEETNG